MRKYLLPILASYIGFSSCSDITKYDESHKRGSIKAYVVQEDSKLDNMINNAVSKLTIENRNNSTTSNIRKDNPSTIDEKLPAVRGMCIPGWQLMKNSDVDYWMSFAKSEHINTLVIDVKDEYGDIYFDTKNLLADTISARAKTKEGEIIPSQIPYLMQRSSQENIRVYARFVMFRDEKMYNSCPDVRLLEYQKWVDPRNSKVIDYEMSLIKEVSEMGFNQIILDYIRFPDQTLFETSEKKYEIIDDIVRKAKGIIHPNVSIGVFVFGCVAFQPECAPIGQRVTSLVDVVDNIYPMLYPELFAPGEFGLEKPADYPYEIISRGYNAGVKQSRNSSKIIPMLQAYDYDEFQISEQVRAAIDNKARGFIFWDNYGKYNRIRGVVNNHWRNISITSAKIE